MISKRELGPRFAIAGAVVVAGAVVAGFLTVGGPGDARDQRLDEMTEDRIADAVRTAQCAYFATGEAPTAIEQTSVTIAKWPELPIVCNRFEEIASRPGVRSNAQPEAPGDVTYQKVDGGSIRVCGNFRRPNVVPNHERHPRGRGDVIALFPVLHEDRPEAGVHCYDLKLAAKPAT